MTSTFYTSIKILSRTKKVFFLFCLFSLRLNFGLSEVLFCLTKNGWKRILELFFRFQRNIQDVRGRRKVHDLSAGIHFLRKRSASLRKYAFDLRQIGPMFSLQLNLQEQKCLKRTPENQAWSLPAATSSAFRIKKMLLWYFYVIF